MYGSTGMTFALLIQLNNNNNNPAANEISLSHPSEGQHGEGSLVVNSS